MSTSVASRKAKGKQFEKRMCHLFAEAFSLRVPQDIRTAVSRETGTDVRLVSERAIELIGLAIECKNQKSLNVFKALEQTKNNSYDRTYDKDLVPALCFRKSEKGQKENWIATPIEHYLELRKKILELEDIIYVGKKKMEK